MKLYSVLSNAYKLDGGAMFGNSPKAVWEHWIPADKLNRLHLATRALLVITHEETILFETGIGAYMEPRLKDRYGVNEPEHVLLKSLEQRRISQADVTRIFISHLHFDHAGGLLGAWQPDKEPELLFPNASYYVGEQAWERAIHPNPRDRASFIPDLQQLLQMSGRLVLLRKDTKLSFDDLDLHFFQSDGHTPGLMCADIRYDHNRLVYASDLIPGTHWVHLPITMGYDRFPELLIEEKKALLSSLVEEDASIFYVHDPDFAVSRVKPDPKRNSFTAFDAQKDLNID